MEFLYGILIVLGLFIAVTLIRGVFYKAKPPVSESFAPEQVNEKRAADNLSRAIQIKTISNEDESKVDWSEFQRFHEFLKEAYPLIHSTMEVEDVSKASLLFKWQGSDDSLEPIAFLSHQDVVPVTPGTEGDWEHPPFEGFNDGEFVWGRGALDMKNHLICLMESITATATMTTNMFSVRALFMPRLADNEGLMLRSIRRLYIKYQTT